MDISTGSRPASAGAGAGGSASLNGNGQQDAQSAKGRRKGKKDGEDGAKKRRCISSACVPCRKRKSKCDGTTPACSACAAVYNTPCIYDPNSDHRRKGVYKKDIDNLKTRNETLQTLVQAILNYPEEEVAALVQQIRTCESLDAVADAIAAKGNGEDDDEEPLEPEGVSDAGKDDRQSLNGSPTFESHLSGKMGELRLDHGSTRYIGGTSHLIYLGAGNEGQDTATSNAVEPYSPQMEDPLTSWTTVTSDPELVRHLINMYFCWHYSFFTTLSKQLFMKEFHLGKAPPGSPRRTSYCTPLLVNAMLALGCHFTSWPGARAVRDDSATAGDHFFKEAKRLILEDDLHEVPALTTVQALALMSVREAGCGREAKGWVYSGMSFRMACDLGLNLGMGRGGGGEMGEVEEDARRITFWGCFLFDKCWSNYLGRLPQLPSTIVTVPKFDVFPVEDSEIWSAYTDSGISQAHSQPARTRAVALQISKLCEISSDLMNYFYNPIDMDKAKGKQTELKKLSELHQRLETWRRELPKELEPKEGGLPSMLVMHMFFQLLFIHLFRPFLKYNPNNSPLPAHVSPRKLCTQAAAMISKLLRLYKRSHGLRQICNIVVYIAHSACTIHLLNLPDKNAKRDIVHGVKHLEEIAEGWLCARRTLGILSTLVKRWKVDLPDEAKAVLERTDGKFGPWEGVCTPRPSSKASPNFQQFSPQQMMEDIQPHPQISPILQPYSLTLANSAAQFFQQPRLPPTSTSTTTSATSPSSHMPPLSDPHLLPQQQYNSPVQSISTPTATTTAALANNISTPPPHHNHNPNNILPTAVATPTSNNSPSQLFGGVEQLIREGQDWWLRDQNQLAVGFDNWGYAGGADGADLSWFAAAGQGQPQQQSQQAQVQQQQQTQVQNGTTVDGNGVVCGSEGGGVNGSANNRASVGSPGGFGVAGSVVGSPGPGVAVGQEKGQGQGGLQNGGNGVSVVGFGLMGGLYNESEWYQ